MSIKKVNTLPPAVTHFQILMPSSTDLPTSYSSTPNLSIADIAKMGYLNWKKLEVEIPGIEHSIQP